MIWWNNLPSGALIDLFIPSADVDEILRLASYRAGANPLERVDAHTIRTAHPNVSYIPLPGGLTKLIPCLLSVQLPEGVAAGQEFRVIVQQYAGREKRVIGAVELRVPVRHKEEILPVELRKLAVLKYIKTKIPPSDRWFPVFERYVQAIGDRVRGCGGDPDAVQPTNHVTSRPGAGGLGPRPDVESVVGKVADVLYDCYGDFEGFVLEACGERTVFNCCEAAVEEVVRRACRERSRITVYSSRSGERRPLQITVHCC